MSLSVETTAARACAGVDEAKDDHTVCIVDADSITEQSEAHPDAHIVKSLPRAGTLRAARPLAEIGDARGRFPTAESLACLTGVTPSNRESGKVQAVTFRWTAACAAEACPQTGRDVGVSDIAAVDPYPALAQAALMHCVTSSRRSILSWMATGGSAAC